MYWPRLPHEFGIEISRGGKSPYTDGFPAFEKNQSKKNKLHLKIELIAYFTTSHCRKLCTAITARLVCSISDSKI